MALCDDEAETTIAECLRAADEFKNEGNDHFRARRWEEALVAYRAGLGRVPKRRKSEIQPEVQPEADIDEDPTSSDGTAPTQVSRNESTPKEDEVPMTPEETECAKARAVLNANIGACFVKLDDHKQVVEACTEALLDDPNYVKALQRRAASNEKINSWSSLTATQEDYTTLLKILPSSNPQIKEIERSQHLLKPRLEAAQKAETAEMLDKLKGLGNSILGNFGLSTDNFKFEPNGQGGYSMNFTR
ncbi:hypothetical protein K438DRAFT_1803857 [Mycena galopus ATCC 62051]|nr:hypothetical protein K438DRAFT_1803857 [Mycena galopus ATCC 62051]